MYILYLYVQTITRQCFCFPNSQWGVTAHDTIEPGFKSQSSDGSLILRSAYYISYFCNWTGFLQQQTIGMGI